MDPLDRGRSLAVRGGRNALDGLLAVAETWETRPEHASPGVVRASWMTSLGLLVGGGLTLWITASLRHSSLRGFFWIHPMARWEHSLIGFYFALSIALVLLGVVGLLIAWVMSSQPTGAATRYFVAGEAVVIAGAATGEAFVIFLFVIQLALWIAAFAVGMMLLFGLFASLAGG